MEELLKMANELHKNAKAEIDKLLTPEVMEKMTPDQRALVNAARNPLNLSGDLDKKADELNEILKRGTHGV